jgi:hypothetical protein
VEIRCPQCGGDVNVIEGQTFLTCKYCSSAIYIDKSQVVFHYMLNPTLDQTAAEASLKRWMAGSETVKGLDKEAVIANGEFIYFPIWYFKIKKVDVESIKFQPALPTPIPDIKKLSIPAGDMRFFNDSDVNNPAIREPQVLYTSAIQWLINEGVDTSTITQSALIHIPLYIFHYTHKDNTYNAVVDGASSKVMVSEFPSKSEIPYQIIGGGAMALFFIEGMRLGFPEVLGAYILTALIVIIAATLVVERV